MGDTESRDLTYAEPADADYATASWRTPFRAIWLGVRANLRGRPAQVMLVFLVGMFLWGHHGDLRLLSSIWPAWDPRDISRVGRPQLLPWVPWDRELIVFFGGAFLMVAVPSIVIKWVFKEPLRDYGLGLPPRGRRRFAVWVVVTQLALWAIPFWLAARDPLMRITYPEWQVFSSIPQFLLFECTSFFFFLSIEFMFRGFIMYGLAKPSPAANSWGGALRLYALFFQMLAYVTWHLGKPPFETAGLLFWGLISGTLVLACRSIWPIVIVHWLLNVFMHAIILGYI